MSDEWGPWIEHDGKGCPCPGQMVQGVDGKGRVAEWVANSTFFIENVPIGRSVNMPDDRCAWSWAIAGNKVEARNHVIRYRIRRPSALQTLIEIAANPVPLPEEVDA